MNAKYLLGGLLLSGLLLTGCQSQVKQSVSAETKESISLQQEELNSEPAASSVIASEELETVGEAETATTSASTSKPSESIEESKTAESSTVPSSAADPVIKEASEESAIKESETKAPHAAPAPEAVQAVQPALPAAKVEENFQFSVAKNKTTEEFIQAIGKDAQQIAWDEGLYASVMIAQAILETGSGNSQLARPPHHNLFGIKGSYQGKQVNFNTQEDKGNGQLYTINSAFRQYPSYKESLEDYAALLKNGLSGNPGFYQGTWKANAATHEEAAKALTGKYATDTAYDKKLNALIETYQLTSYDQEPNKEAPLASAENETTDADATEKTNDSVLTDEETNQEPEVRTSRTKQPVIFVPPTAQRPAKQLSGNRIAQ